MSNLGAESIACSEGSHEAKWLLQLHRDIHGKDTSPLPIKCGNQGALSLIPIGIIKARTKHIDVSYHNNRYLDVRRIVDYFYVCTNKIMADIPTKALSKDKHNIVKKAMGLL